MTPCVLKEEKKSFREEFIPALILQLITLSYPFLFL